MVHEIPPKVSIIITASNYERYLEECIISCLGQDKAAPYEVIVVDDGSTDGTAEIARSFEPDIQVIVIEDSGVERASNIGLEQATGDYVVRVDADDRLKPDYLSTLVPEAEKGPVNFVYAEYTEINAAGNAVKDVSLPEFDVVEIQGRGDFLATGTLYSKETVTSLGGYNERVRNCGLENYELILRLLASGHTGKCIHHPLFDYRIHDSSMSSLRRQSIIDYGKTLAAEFGLPAYRTNESHPYGLIL